MAASGTGRDSLRIEYSGAASDGATQYDPDLCLGGFRSSQDVERAVFAVTHETMQALRIERVYGGTTGRAVIAAVDADTVRYLAPGDTDYGADVALTAGTAAVLVGDTATEQVRVIRVGTGDLTRRMVFDVLPVYNGIPAMGDVANAERVAGSIRYRAVFLRGMASCTSVTAWTAAGEGLALASETPGADGSIQTIANDTTEPTGRSWNTGNTLGTGLSIGTLAAGSTIGLWIRRTVSPGATATAKQAATIYVSWTAGGVTYTETLAGLYRIADDSLALYEAYLGIDAEPDLTGAATATGASLPLSVAVTPPPSGTRTYHCVLRRRNKYGVISQNVYSRLVRINSAGAQVALDPTAPSSTTVVDAGGGYVTVRAIYAAGQDSSPADTWQVYETSTGADPVPGVDTPTEYAMGTASPYSGGIELDQDIGPYPVGADVRVIVRTKRASDSLVSTNTTATTVTVASDVPAVGVHRSATYTGRARILQAVPTVSESDTYSVPYSVVGAATPGITTLYVGATLLFKVRYDSSGASTNGFWVPLGYKQEQISGAASANPVEAVSATEIYLTVAGIRRMKYNGSTSRWHFSAIKKIGVPVSSGAAGPIIAYPDHTLIQVWDPATWVWATAAVLDSTGVLYLAVPWRQRNSAGDIP